MTKYDRDYLAAMIQLHLVGYEEVNQRTGKEVRSLPGVTFRTDLEADGFPLLSLRKLPMSFIPEVMWMLSGSKRSAWLSRHTKIWDAFADDEGIIEAAYGHRWRYHFDVDQLEFAIMKLRMDPSTRHAVVVMWDPKEDVTTPRKNVPCPVMFTLMVMGGRLHLHLVIRSNDMVLGHPTDVAGYALLTHILAQHLGVKPGVLTVSISNAHYYLDQQDAVNELMSRNTETRKVVLTLPENAYRRSMELDDSLIKEIKDGITEYKPGPAIKNIPIAL
jgi:thymidylate synthase